MVAVNKSEEARRLRANEAKWSTTLIDAGWTLLPSTILEYQQELGLDPVDVNILLQIARHWWKPGDAPFPSIRTVADCIGMSMSAVQRHVSSMRDRGIIEIRHRTNKHGGQTSSEYYFAGLIEKATPFAEELIEARAEKKRTKVDRKMRGAKKKSPSEAGFKIVN